MKIGLFFGSFNPIHLGHLIIANYMLHHSEMDEVWLMVSPHNPLKDKSGLANMYDRLEMVQLALENTEGLKASDFEFKLPQPSYTIDTLAHLKEKYPQHQFALIMGGDNLATIHKWKNYELLLRDYHLYIYPRPGADISKWENHPAVTLTETPNMEISSTWIRKNCQNPKNIKFLLPDKVIHFIDSKGLYQH